MLASRSYIIEKQFVPALTAVSPIMAGIDSAPPLLGYVATTAKQTAQVILRTGDTFNDPILASWQYGLGRAVAFTSDATARWGSNWVSWTDFARFWSQAVRWTITEGTNNNVEAQVVMEGEQAKLVVDARDADGNFLNGLNLRSSLLSPDRSCRCAQHGADLAAGCTGTLRSYLRPTSEGAYLLTLTDDQQTIRQTTGWVMSYSPEYRPQGASILPDIAGLTNGKQLALDDPGIVFTHDLVAQASLTPIAPFLLLLALLLLPFDIAVRRLLVTRTDLVRARDALLRRSADVAREPSERLSTLMGAKARAQQQISEQGSPASAAATASTLRSRREQRRSEGDLPAASEAPLVPDDQPRYTRPAPLAPPSPQAEAKPEAEGNVAAQLLKRRKERE